MLTAPEDNKKYESNKVFLQRLRVTKNMKVSLNINIIN